jgi:ABC-type glutathione transport system ATPase component
VTAAGPDPCTNSAPSALSTSSDAHPSVPVSRIAPKGRGPSSADVILEVKDLVVEFPQGRSTVRAVDHVNLDLRAGEVLGVVGESGSGKSTLGRTVAGFARATSGQVLLPGANGGLATRSSSHGYRDVQMIFQESAAALDPRTRIDKIILEAYSPNPPLLWRGRQVRIGEVEQVRAALQRVELPATFVRKRSKELSGGEKQRIAIARALAARPTIIVCDEAVSALDVAVRAVILNLLARLRRETGVALLFISHDISVVGHLADRLVVMHDGKLVESGTVSEVLDNPQDAYTKQLIHSVPTLELKS